MADSDFPVCKAHCGVDDKKGNVPSSELGFVQIQFTVKCNIFVQETEIV